MSCDALTNLREGCDSRPLPGKTCRRPLSSTFAGGRGHGEGSGSALGVVPLAFFTPLQTFGHGTPRSGVATMKCVDNASRSGLTLPTLVVQSRGVLVTVVTGCHSVGMQRLWAHRLVHSFIAGFLAILAKLCLPYCPARRDMRDFLKKMFQSREPTSSSSAAQPSSEVTSGAKVTDPSVSEGTGHQVTARYFELSTEIERAKATGRYLTGFGRPVRRFR